MLGKKKATERRKRIRRKIKDRRESIRWEPEKADRRQGSGRRADDKQRDQFNDMFDVPASGVRQR
ncbi:MAG: hypothetical protein ACE5K1_10815 [Acidiferrobacterales bacterium]